MFIIFVNFHCTGFESVEDSAEDSPAGDGSFGLRAMRGEVKWRLLNVERRKLLGGAERGKQRRGERRRGEGGEGRGERERTIRRRRKSRDERGEGDDGDGQQEGLLEEDDESVKRNEMKSSKTSGWVRPRIPQ